ncbi:MAG: RNA 2',3'-cyclic phosphodiesterase [Lysobacter sp.]
MRQQSDLFGFDAAPQRDIRRLFFALWPDQALRERIEETTVRLADAHGTRGRPTAPERYHLTLQFLGDFQGRQQPLIDSVVAAADSVRSAAFELMLDHAGSFGRTKVGWLGPASMPAGLQRLWDALGLALAKRGIRPKSAASLTPHVTVLRGMRKPLPPIAIPPLVWSADSFVLIESRFGQGAYAEVQRWPLLPGTAS